ncbi:hypothetical protein GCM10011514_30260 [Emticicia aquatilis]|uniref:Uncharacterized protein n=1 Tax=Emticicia aquatilis TaxID=1537369 RepID=A0A917DSC7_9BACT|nr:hypothetical protein [Emticicia aquatilis]GGD64243.1 hypothetical protein GCM10011514_30260 [Emticicia aquatilis]
MMNNSNENTTKKPTHNIYITKLKTGAEKPEWIKVGAAWEHGDEEGLNLSLNILGETVSMVVRKNRAKAE